VEGIVDRELIDECVHCGFCLPTCPTYVLWREEMDSPRGRIQLMAAALDGEIELNDTVVEHFDACLGCVSCVTACPSGVEYGTLIELTRERVEQEHRRGAGDRLLRGAIFALFPHPRRLRRALALAPLSRVVPAPGRLGLLAELAPPWADSRGPAATTAATGTAEARAGLLTGCVASVVFGDVNRATARALSAWGIETVTPSAGCCGALHVHAGRREAGRRRARRTIEAFERAGVDVVVTNAAGCGSHMKEYGRLLADDPAFAERAERFSARVRDVSEVLADGAPRAELHPLELRVALQDACHLRHAQGVVSPPRRMLGAVPGLTLAEPAEQDICCGSAGIYNLVRPDAARELGDRKAANVARTEPDAYAAGNPGCLIQVTAALRRAGRPTPAFHPVELVDASLRGEPADRLLRSARR
jgi:glycolate oxidase iron-sulfur subunit